MKTAIKSIALALFACSAALLWPCWATAEVALYATDAYNQSLHTLNPANGAATLVGYFGVGGYMAGLFTISGFVN